MLVELAFELNNAFGLSLIDRFEFYNALGLSMVDRFEICNALRVQKALCFKHFKTSEDIDD